MEIIRAGAAVGWRDQVLMYEIIVLCAFFSVSGYMHVMPNWDRPCDEVEV